MSTDILDTLDDLEEMDNLGPEFQDDEVGSELDLISDDSNDLDEKRAKEITEAIRSAATVTFLLLTEAHNRNAHRALGYDTWAEYVQTEFEMSPQRSYQLLDLGKVINEIEAVLPEGTSIKLTEAQARDIKRELPHVTERISEELSSGSDEDASATVDRVINEIRDQKKTDDKAAEAKQKAIDEAQEDGYRAGLEAAADSLLESDGPSGLTNSADGEFVEVTVEGESNGDLSPEDSMNLYNFFNVLSGLTSLPEPDEFLKIVPKNRANEIENQLLEAVSWLNRFQTLWEVENE
jgi:hypothetical protein